MKTVTFAYIDEPPFISPSRNGGWPLGCDAELAAAVFTQMEHEHGMLTARAIEVRFGDLLPGVAAGRWIFNTALFVTEERRKKVRFSRPVWALADGLLIRAGDAGRFDTYEAIAAEEAARLGVVSDQVQRETGLMAGIDSPEAVVKALQRGEIDAYASVAFAHRGLLQRMPDKALAISDLSAPVHEGRADSAPALGAFSFALENRAFADAFDHALSGFLGSTEHVKIMARYGFTARDGLAWGRAGRQFGPACATTEVSVFCGRKLSWR